MATVTSLLNSSVEVPVVDQTGEPLHETRTFVNTPLRYYFPDDTFIVIDWLAHDETRPTVEEISKPVVVDGVAYQGDKCGGSLVKNAQTFGVMRDYLTQTGLAHKISDVVRFKRAFLVDGLYGGGILDDLEVTIVEAGKLYKGLPVEDGWGYISKSLVAKLSNGHSLIKSNGSREAFQFWQSIPWTPEVQKECLPLIMDQMVAMADPSVFAFNNNSAHQSEKREWALLDEPMRLHPFVANAFARDLADSFRRAAGTCPTNARWKVAVPTTLSQAAVSEETILYRYPIDSYAAIQAVDADENAQGEIDRIAEMEIVQFTLLDPKVMFASGCLGVVEDDVLGGPDVVVICADNIKMAVNGSLDQVKKMSSITLSDAALVFPQHYEAGSGLGLNTAFFKKMGGDFDGDLVTYFNVNQDDRSFKAVAEAVRNLPAGSSLKLKKSKIALSNGDRRGEMLGNNMRNLVGFASNLRSATFMLEDRNEMARALGFRSVVEMDELLNFYISAGTDGYKSFVLYKRVRGHDGKMYNKPITIDELEKEAGVIQSNIISLFKKMAPETGWARSDWAFRQRIPQIIEDGDSTEHMDKDEKRLAIEWWMTGTVQEIAKITLPNMNAALDTPVESRPLSYYRRWASRPDSDLYEAVMALQIQYNGRVKRLNFSSSDATMAFKAWWAQTLDTFVAESGHDRFAVANALWSVAHSTRSTASGAASIFIGMPEEAKRIILEKPGKQGGQAAQGLVMTGLTYNVQNPLASWIGEVEVVYHTVSQKGKAVHRAVVCPIGDHPFEFQAKDADNVWPEGMLGVISTQTDQPEEGFYAASYTQKGNSKAWQLTLS
jgi:hypothetical protein